MKSITLVVKEMTCGHCETSVNGALSELEGVEPVDVKQMK